MFRRLFVVWFCTGLRRWGSFGFWHPLGDKGKEFCPERPTRFFVSQAGVADANGDYSLIRLPSHEGRVAYQKRGSSIFISRWHNTWAIAPASAGSESCFLYFTESHGAEARVPPVDGWVSGPQGKDPAPSVIDLDLDLRMREINGTAPEVEVMCCDGQGIRVADGQCALEKITCDGEYDFSLSLIYASVAIGICISLLVTFCGLKERARRRLSQSWRRDGMQALEKASPSISLSHPPGALVGNACSHAELGAATYEDDDCAICLERLRMRQVRVLHCKHILHADCIDQYLTHKGGPPTEWCCPTCKQYLLPGSLKHCPA
eukprot:gnl/MRDRNA2_/MRDRNA2_85080_c0_seq1.p1 gnl/MRDRNA2_/MRDRNA2_85080_c0~~gnl/MRDRNA2_/MRDRNA2_85080_c0_seq1.p1  ORF type:complete len:319 (+),score=39.89 gnl/MRDRNA2_/MRDRNA2_85080_c0_seq1:144-1100(+)